MAYTTLEYQFSTSTSQPPTGSQVRLNHADQASSTLLWMTYITNPGQDIRNYLRLINVGDRIFLQDWDDSTRYLMFELVAPVSDKGTYAELSLSPLFNGIPLLGQKIALAFGGPTQELPIASRDPGDVLTIDASGNPVWEAPQTASGPAPTPPVAVAGDCPWPVDPACLGDQWDDLDPDVQVRATGLASATLRRLTGYRVGGCPITVRPCRQSCTNTTLLPSYWSRMGQGPFFPHVGMSGMWVNSCGCTTDCTCEVLCEVKLPGPVGAVYQVLVDGALVTDYSLYGTTLVWTGTGTCPWPICQNLALADDQPGTFSITYLNSYPVDALGAYAAGTLAYEYAQACTGNKCRLPSNVTTLTRQGVTMDLATGSFPGGFTGIREVDAFIAIYNPRGLREQTRVYSPDIHPPRVPR